MTPTYGLADYVADLRRIARAGLAEPQLLDQVGPLTLRLAGNRDLLDPARYPADPVQGFGLHLLHEEADHSLAVFAISWLPGSVSPTHDHGTWAAVAGVTGVERNLRYARVDDGSRPGFAELELKRTIDVGPGDLLCVRTGGIHAVRNDSGELTLSLHTYGRHINHTTRSQYDLQTGEIRPIAVRVS
jgi:predicted metal-dependent enzyme (double-stranded beta helix superfamily)